MTAQPPCPAISPQSGLLARLLRDGAGNTLAMVAAALLPLIGLLGGGIDMGRGYLSQSRLQQACDAGVLAARKRLGTDVAVSGEIPEEAAESGERFFNVNFRNGAYGTRDRTFAMSLEADFSVAGQATVVVPTTLMAVFGYREMPVSVSCRAQLNMSNMDVMMVLDTTGSMAQTNPGDTQSKIAVLRDVVRSFYAQLEANKVPGARTRYGFVPYSSNVNVGYLLESDWVVDEITIPARVSVANANTPLPTMTPVSGTATPLAPSVASSCPQSTLDWVDGTIVAQPNGRRGRSTLNGTEYSCDPIPLTGLFTVTGTVYTNYVVDWFLPNGNSAGWRYENMTLDVSALNGSSGEAVLLDGAAGAPVLAADLDPLGLISQFRGCIMERSTYEIDDYDSVDRTRALDLDIDAVPDPSDPATQWRPLLSEVQLVKSPAARNISDLDTLLDNVTRNLVSASLLARPSCPARARNLAPMTASEVTAYVNSLQPVGNTYHDIGMIWGGRLLSPTGLFAAANADQPSRPTSRHLIFLTDGETATAHQNLATYGIEPVETRRWRQNSRLTLNQTVEQRFAYACEEVKKKNITVWVISFGTAANPVMQACAGDGRYFVADDADALNESFATIAKRMGELRMTR